VEANELDNDAIDDLASIRQSANPCPGRNYGPIPRPGSYGTPDAPRAGLCFPGSHVCHFRPETGEGTGEPTGQPHHEVSASWAGSGPAIAAAEAAATGPRVRARRRADAVTREGGVAATALQVKRDVRLNKSERQAVSMRHRIAIERNRQTSLQTQNYHAGSRCRSMATSREITSENAVQRISMRVCNALLVGSCEQDEITRGPGCSGAIGLY
jgi:hypothetical protein